MRREFRNRVFLPIVLPLAILGFIAAVVAVFALILLYNTHEAALALATVMAAGILLTVALAASRDRLDAGRRLVVVGAGVVPILLGAGFALGLFGNVDPALLNINRQPEVQFPDWAPVIVSTQPADFDADSITLPPEPPEGEELAIVFDNQSGIGHNFTLHAGPEPDSDVLAETETYEEGEEAVTFEPQEPGEYYFVCTVHASSMFGTLTIAEGEEPSVGEGGGDG